MGVFGQRQSLDSLLTNVKIMFRIMVSLPIELIGLESSD